MVSSTDLSATWTWVHVAEDFQHPTTLLAYQTFLHLLTHHVATLPPLPQHHTLLKDLTSSLVVDTFSACLRNLSPIHGVELLEQGQGIFWSQLNCLHFLLDDVIASSSTGKPLVDKFTQKTFLIRTALDSPGPDQHDQVYHLKVELQGVITRIHKLSGLSHFLLPLSFSELQQAACKGPVIIVNVSKYGCDALIVLVDQHPIHIPLSVTLQGVRELLSRLHSLIMCAKSMVVKRDIAITLQELWDEVVFPIVNFIWMYIHYNHTSGGAPLLNLLFFPSMLPVHTGWANGILPICTSHLILPPFLPSFMLDSMISQTLH